MYRGTVNEVAKIWDEIGGRQIEELRVGTVVFGGDPRGDGYVLLTSPVVGYTKTRFLTGYQLMEEPEPPPPPTARVLKHTIRIYDNGSIQIDDGAIIP